MKLKQMSYAVLATVALFCAAKAEARTCFSLNLGALFAPPVEHVVVEHYPCYQQPVYVAPVPVYHQPQVVYVAPRPCRPVMVHAPRPMVHSGVSFGWHSCRR